MINLKGEIICLQRHTEELKTTTNRDAYEKKKVEIKATINMTTNKAYNDK